MAGIDLIKKVSDGILLDSFTLMIIIRYEILVSRDEKIIIKISNKNLT